MTQPLVDLRGLLRGLHEREIEYLVFGAIGMLFYGYVRNTEDLDIIVSPEQANIDRVADWLIALDAALVLNPNRRFGSRERWRMQQGANATVITSLGQLDVVQRLPGLSDWGTLRAEAELYELDGIVIPVLARGALIDLKRRRGSPQDLADIEVITLLADL